MMGKPILVGTHTAAVYSIAFNLDSNILASGDYHGTILLWDCQKNTGIGELNGFDMINDQMPIMIKCIMFSPDSQRIAAGIADYQGEEHLRLWKINTRNEYARCATEEVLALAFNHDGAVLACGTGAGAVELRDGHTGELTATLTGHDDYVAATAFNSDGTLLVSGTAFEEGKVRIWDVSKQIVLTTVQGQGNIEHVKFSTDNKYLYWIDWAAIHVWDIESARELATWPQIGYPNITVMNSRCTMVATTMKKGERSDKRGSRIQYAIRLIDLATGHTITESLKLVENISSLAFSANDQMLALGTSDGEVYLWNL
jgi:WD40 repeat protein